MLKGNQLIFIRFLSSADKLLDETDADGKSHALTLFNTTSFYRVKLTHNCTVSSKHLKSFSSPP